jgi:hypothetical protein
MSTYFTLARLSQVQNFIHERSSAFALRAPLTKVFEKARIQVSHFLLSILCLIAPVEEE